MKHLKVYESLSPKFTDDFIDLINYACLDLIDNHYTIEIWDDLYSLLGGSLQAYYNLKSGDKAIVESLKIKIKTKFGRFDENLMLSVLSDIERIAADFDFLVDLNIDEDDYISLDDLKDYFFPLSDFNTIKIVIY